MPRKAKAGLSVTWGKGPREGDVLTLRNSRARGSLKAASHTYESFRMPQFGKWHEEEEKRA